MGRKSEPKARSTLFHTINNRLGDLAAWQYPNIANTRESCNVAQHMDSCDLAVQTSSLSMEVATSFVRTAYGEHVTSTGSRSSSVACAVDRGTQMALDTEAQTDPSPVAQVVGATDYHWKHQLSQTTPIEAGTSHQGSQTDLLRVASSSSVGTTPKTQPNGVDSTSSVLVTPSTNQASPRNKIDHCSESPPTTSMPQVAPPLEAYQEQSALQQDRWAVRCSPPPSSQSFEKQPRTTFAAANYDAALAQMQTATANSTWAYQGVPMPGPAATHPVSPPATTPAAYPMAPTPGHKYPQFVPPPNFYPPHGMPWAPYPYPWPRDRNLHPGAPMAAHLDYMTPLPTESHAASPGLARPRQRPDAALGVDADAMYRKLHDEINVLQGVEQALQQVHEVQAALKLAEAQTENYNLAQALRHLQPSHRGPIEALTGVGGPQTMPTTPTGVVDMQPAQLLKQALGLPEDFPPAPPPFPSVGATGQQSTGVQSGDLQQSADTASQAMVPANDEPPVHRSESAETVQAPPPVPVTTADTAINTEPDLEAERVPSPSKSPAGPAGQGPITVVAWRMPSDDAGTVRYMRRHISKRDQVKKKPGRTYERSDSDSDSSSPRRPTGRDRKKERDNKGRRREAWRSSDSDGSRSRRSSRKSPPRSRRRSRSSSSSEYRRKGRGSSTKPRSARRSSSISTASVKARPARERTSARSQRRRDSPIEVDISVESSSASSPVSRRRRSIESDIVTDGTYSEAFESVASMSRAGSIAESVASRASSASPGRRSGFQTLGAPMSSFAAPQHTQETRSVSASSAVAAVVQSISPDAKKR